MGMNKKLNDIGFKVSGVSLWVFLIGSFISPMIGMIGLVVMVISLLTMWITSILIDKEKSNEW